MVERRQTQASFPWTGTHERGGAQWRLEWNSGVWEHMCWSARVDGAGLKQLAVGEHVLRVSLRPERRRLGTWRKGVGSPTQTGQFWVRNDQRSSNGKMGGRGALGLASSNHLIVVWEASRKK